MTKKSAFIVTKPLQYVNATNIGDNQRKDCIISDSFYNAKKFCSIIEEHSNRWDKVEFCTDTLSAVKYVIRNKHEYSKVYIDSDFGILLSFYLKKLKHIDIYTYEEGYASYVFIRNNTTLQSRVKAIIAKILGLKNWVGGYSKTKGMYLYQHDKFIANIGTQKNKQLLSFEQPFATHIKSLKELNILFNDIDFSVYKNREVVLYMTNYFLNEKAVDLLASYPNHIKVIKPHPQISKSLAIFSKFDYVIENYLPAEILIERLLSPCKSLTIIHEGSFALEYFTGDEKVNEIFLAK